MKIFNLSLHTHKNVSQQGRAKRAFSIKRWKGDFLRVVSVALCAGCLTTTYVHAQNALADNSLGTKMPHAISLPTPLNSEVERDIHMIFLLQEEGHYAQAQKIAARLTPYFSLSADDKFYLKEVLGASDKKNANRARDKWLSWFLTHTYQQPDINGRRIVHNHALENQIHRMMQNSNVSVESLLRVIANTRGVTETYAAWLETDLCQTFLMSGNIDGTLETARMGISHAHGRDAAASFYAGLALWQKAAYRESIPFFEQAASIPYAPDDIQPASMFWTARAYGKAHKNIKEKLWLEKTALYFPDNFYGFLALATLDSNEILDGARKTIPQMRQTIVDTSLYNYATNTPKQDDINAVNHLSGGASFFALLQIGDRSAAEELFIKLASDTHNINLEHSLLVVAKSADLKKAQTEISKSLANEQASYDRRNSLTMPNLSPKPHFSMDPALVYALIRVESNFNPRVRSGADARGLMQIQPVTADFITSSSLRHPNFWYRHHPNALFTPQINITIGQDYVQYLAKLSRHVEFQKTPGGDIVRILASYNAGPSALEQWENLTDSPTDDPVLFIELLPNKETRDYVHKTLTYLWRYADKMRITTPSLFSLSQGLWPAFADETALSHQ